MIQLGYLLCQPPDTITKILLETITICFLTLLDLPHDQGNERSMGPECECVHVCECVCKMEEDREGGRYHGIEPAPEIMQKSALRFSYRPLNRILVGIFGFRPVEFQVHSPGQPLTVPQRCECPGVLQAQYFTLLVQNDFNSSFPHPAPIPIKKLLDPQRARAQPGLKRPRRAEKGPALSIPV